MPSTLNFDTNADAAKVSPRKFNRREKKVLESVQERIDSGMLGLKAVQAEIDFATAGNRTVADHGLGVTLPVGAVVTKVLRKVTADLDSTSQTGTAQLFLGASSGGANLDVALACDGASVVEAWNEQIDGTSKKPYVQTVASTAKELTVKIATNAITSTSGKIQFIVFYVIPA